MLVDVGDDKWVEADLVTCVERVTRQSAGPQQEVAAVTQITLRDGQQRRTSMAAKDVGNRIRGAQIFAITKGVSGTAA